MEKIAIIGVGVIGGSIGIDVRKKKLANEVVGVVHRESSIEECIRLGIVDKATLSVAEGVSGADLVILSTPISRMSPIAEEMLKNLKKDAIVIDVASVKGKLVKLLEEILGDHFVGTHPMAGSEKKGLAGVRGEMFRDAMCIITPTTKTRPKFLEIVKRFWDQLGAKTIVLSPEEHDKLVSLTSHLPHLVAACLVNSIADQPKAELCVGPGFKDSTRIAKSPAELWKEVCEWNKDEILSSITKFQGELADIKMLIETSNWAMLLQRLQNAKDVRDKL